MLEFKNDPRVLDALKQTLVYARALNHFPVTHGRAERPRQKKRVDARAMDKAAAWSFRIV